MRKTLRNKLYFATQAVRRNEIVAQEVADLCDVSRSAVYMWQTLGKVPAEHALIVAQYLKVSPHRVRPDLYPLNILRQAAE